MTLDRYMDDFGATSRAPAARGRGGAAACASRSRSPARRRWR